MSVLGLFRDNSAIYDKLLKIGIAAAIVLSIAGTVYFDPGIINILEGMLLTVLTVKLPNIWPYIQPAMPLLNVAFYLLGAIAVFLLSKEYIVTDRYVYFAVAAYLLYFPLAGMNWSTFTTISMFPTLFLLGFYFYKVEFRWISGILFILAATTMIFYSIIVVMSGFVLLAKDNNRSISVRENHFAVSLMLISLLVFFIQAVHGLVVSHYGIVNMGGYGYLLHIIRTITYAKPLFFIALFVPLITFGFFGPRLLPVSLPYFLLGIITTVAGTSPEPLVAILDMILPLAFIGSLSWIGKKVDVGIMPTETRIMRFALFSLILMNILVVVTYFPFLSILAKLLGI